MKRRLYFFPLSILLIGILFNAVCYIVVFCNKQHARNLYRIVQSHRRVYTYETWRNALNAVVYIDNLKDSNSLINFYDCWMRGVDTGLGAYDIKTMPITTKYPIYVLSDMKPGSKMIELIDFDTICWGYIKGFVYKATIHDRPPADSFIIKKEEFYRTFRPTGSNILHPPNPYGWYCKECE